MWDLLLELKDYLSGQIDVVDGDYGVSEPNEAMKLSKSIDYIIAKATGKAIS